MNLATTAIGDGAGMGFFNKLMLSFRGKDYYQSTLLPLMALKRYGFERFYSKQQIRFSADALGGIRYFDEVVALALLAAPGESASLESYRRIRMKFGLQDGGALEVLKVYGKAEKTAPDPFGSHQAAETTGGAT